MHVKALSLSKKIDWKKRESDLLKIISKKNLDKNKWNCVVPGSGGKDSTYQIIKSKRIRFEPSFCNSFYL
jgi:tRNA(Ile)-lysidine synthase TilS/MesJ